MKAMIKATQTLLDYVGPRLVRKRIRWLYIFIGWRLLLWFLMVLTQATLLSSGKWTQYLNFLSIARLTDRGYYPFISHWTEYPPIFPWISVLFYRLSRWMIDGPNSDILFFALLGLIFSLCEIGIFILVYRITRHLVNETLATVAAFIFAITSWPTYLFYGWFDPIAAFFFILALERLLVRRFVISAVAVGLGFLTKLFPLMMVAVVIRVESSIRKRVLYLLVVGGVITGLLLPFVYLGPEMLMAHLRWLSNKSSYQTIYALIDGYYSYGVAPFDLKFIDPDYAGWIHHSSRLPTSLVTGVFGLIGLFVYTRSRPARDNIAILVLSGLIMQLMLLYLKGYSPQYILWFVPLIILILPDARGLWYSLSLTILNVIEFPLYFTFWYNIPAILAVVILARTAIWVLLTIEYWGIYQGRIATPLTNK